MSATLAEGVAHVDQPWEMVIGSAPVSSTGAHNVSTINFFGAIVLGIAALDGLLMGLKYFCRQRLVAAHPSSRQNGSIREITRV